MQLKNSLGGAMTAVVPDEHNTVSIYACGITPYSSAHVGHARTYVVFDLLAHVLRSQGHRVRLVRNITDIDDKIIAAADAAGVTWQELSAKYASENRALMVQTGVEVPDEPKASEFLHSIFWLTKQLLDMGHAYVADGTGDVLYRVSSYQGNLLMNHAEGALRSDQGASRVDAAGKEDMRDFALWKRVPADAPGFSSPWGWGRPGWHIECSAMIWSLFNGHVTIHGGGVDLKFPHHTAEQLQLEPVTGKPLASVWMHNGSVLSNGQKMSKSLGNFVTWQAGLDKAEELVPGLGGQLLRFALLGTHWQKPLDWTEDLLTKTKETLLRLTYGLANVQREPGDNDKFLALLQDNLNVPQAMAQLHLWRKYENRRAVKAALSTLGIDVQAWATYKEPARPSSLTEAEVADIEARRQQARANKDWMLADSLRATLLSAGIKVSDR